MKAVKLTPKQREVFEELKKTPGGGYCVNTSKAPIPSVSGTWTAR